MEWIAGVCVPLIVVVLTWGLKKLDARNTSQHAAAQAAREEIKEMITEVKSDVKETHALLVDHIVWHGQNPKSHPHLEVVSK